MRIFFSRCNRILLQNGGWNQLCFYGFQFFEALIDGDFADLANAVHVFFCYVQVAHLRDKVDDAGSNGMRRVFRNQVVLFNPHGHKHAEFGKFSVYVERTAVSFNECPWFRFLKAGFFGIVQVMFQLIDNRQRIFAPLCCAFVVEMKYTRDFFRSPRASMCSA